jgi:hypothetical protein
MSFNQLEPRSIITWFMVQRDKLGITVTINTTDMQEH